MLNISEANIVVFTRLKQNLEYGVLGGDEVFDENIARGLSFIDCLYHLSCNKNVAFIQQTVPRLLAIEFFGRSTTAYKWEMLTPDILNALIRSATKNNYQKIISVIKALSPGEYVIDQVERMFQNHFKFMEPVKPEEKPGPVVTADVSVKPESMPTPVKFELPPLRLPIDFTQWKNADFENVAREIIHGLIGGDKLDWTLSCIKVAHNGDRTKFYNAIYKHLIKEECYNHFMHPNQVQDLKFLRYSINRILKHENALRAYNKRNLADSAKEFLAEIFGSHFLLDSSINLKNQINSNIFVMLLKTKWFLNECKSPSFYLGFCYEIKHHIINYDYTNQSLEALSRIDNKFYIICNAKEKKCFDAFSEKQESTWVGSYAVKVLINAIEGIYPGYDKTIGAAFRDKVNIITDLDKGHFVCEDTKQVEMLLTYHDMRYVYNVASIHISSELNSLGTQPTLLEQAKRSGVYKIIQTNEAACSVKSGEDDALLKSVCKAKQLKIVTRNKCKYIEFTENLSRIVQDELVANIVNNIKSVLCDIRAAHAVNTVPKQALVNQKKDSVELKAQVQETLPIPPQENKPNYILSSEKIPLPTRQRKTKLSVVHSISVEQNQAQAQEQDQAQEQEQDQAQEQDQDQEQDQEQDQDQDQDQGQEQSQDQTQGQGQNQTQGQGQNQGYGQGQSYDDAEWGDLIFRSLTVKEFGEFIYKNRSKLAPKNHPNDFYNITEQEALNGAHQLFKQLGVAYIHRDAAVKFLTTAKAFQYIKYGTQYQEIQTALALNIGTNFCYSYKIAYIDQHVPKDPCVVPMSEVQEYYTNKVFASLRKDFPLTPKKVNNKPSQDQHSESKLALLRKRALPNIPNILAGELRFNRYFSKNKLIEMRIPELVIASIASFFIMRYNQPWGIELPVDSKLFPDNRCSDIFGRRPNIFPTTLALKNEKLPLTKNTGKQLNLSIDLLLKNKKLPLFKNTGNIFPYQMENKELKIPSSFRLKASKASYLSGKLGQYNFNPDNSGYDEFNYNTLSIIKHTMVLEAEYSQNTLFQEAVVEAQPPPPPARASRSSVLRYICSKKKKAKFPQILELFCEEDILSEMIDLWYDKEKASQYKNYLKKLEAIAGVDSKSIIYGSILVFLKNRILKTYSDPKTSLDMFFHMIARMESHNMLIDFAKLHFSRGTSLESFSESYEGQSKEFESNDSAEYVYVSLAMVKIGLSVNAYCAKFGNTSHTHEYIQINGTIEEKKHRHAKLMDKLLHPEKILTTLGVVCSVKSVNKALTSIINNAGCYSLVDEQIDEIADINLEDKVGKASIYIAIAAGQKIISAEMGYGSSDDITLEELQLHIKQAQLEKWHNLSSTPSLWRYLGTQVKRKKLAFYRKLFEGSEKLVPLQALFVGKTVGAVYKPQHDYTEYFYSLRDFASTLIDEYKRYAVNLYPDLIHINEYQCDITDFYPTSEVLKLLPHSVDYNSTALLMKLMLQFNAHSWALSRTHGKSEKEEDLNKFRSYLVEKDIQVNSNKKLLEYCTKWVALHVVFGSQFTSFLKLASLTGTQGLFSALDVADISDSIEDPLQLILPALISNKLDKEAFAELNSILGSLGSVHKAELLVILTHIAGFKGSITPITLQELREAVHEYRNSKETIKNWTIRVFKLTDCQFEPIKKIKYKSNRTLMDVLVDDEAYCGYSAQAKCPYATAGMKEVLSDTTNIPEILQKSVDARDVLIFIKANGKALDDSLRRHFTSGFVHQGFNLLISAVKKAGFNSDKVAGDGLYIAASKTLAERLLIDFIKTKFPISHNLPTYTNLVHKFLLTRYSDNKVRYGISIALLKENIEEVVSSIEIFTNVIEQLTEAAPTIDTKELEKILDIYTSIVNSGTSPEFEGQMTIFMVDFIKKYGKFKNAFDHLASALTIISEFKDSTKVIVDGEEKEVEFYKLQTTWVYNRYILENAIHFLFTKKHFQYDATELITTAGFIAANCNTVSASTHFKTILDTSDKWASDYLFKYCTKLKAEKRLTIQTLYNISYIVQRIDNKQAAIEFLKRVEDDIENFHLAFKEKTYALPIPQIQAEPVKPALKQEMVAESIVGHSGSGRKRALGLVEYITKSNIAANVNGYVGVYTAQANKIISDTVKYTLDPVIDMVQYGVSTAARSIQKGTTAYLNLDSVSLEAIKAQINISSIESQKFTSIDEENTSLHLISEVIHELEKHKIKVRDNNPELLKHLSNFNNASLECLIELFKLPDALRPANNLIQEWLEQEDAHKDIVERIEKHQLSTYKNDEQYYTLDSEAIKAIEDTINKIESWDPQNKKWVPASHLDKQNLANSFFRMFALFKEEKRFWVTNFDGIKECLSISEMTNSQIVEARKICVETLNDENCTWEQKYDAALGEIALSCVVLRRTTGKFPRHTQILEALKCVVKNGNIMSQIDTGEGKGIIAVMKALYRYATLGCVCIAPSSDTLAERDAAEFNSVFRFFGIPCSSKAITQHSKAKDWLPTGINYSTASNLFLFAKTQLLWDKEIDWRMGLILDEADAALTTPVSNILSVVIREVFYNCHEDKWIEIHKALLEFTKTEIFEKTEAKNYGHNFKEYFCKEFRKSAVHERVKKFLTGPVTDDIIEMLINATIVARAQGEDTFISTEVVVARQKHGHEIKKLEHTAAPIITTSHQHDESVTWSEGVQPALHQKKNEERKAKEKRYKHVAVTEKIAAGITPNLIYAVAKAGGVTDGITGSAGSAFELDEFEKVSYFNNITKHPRFSEDKRKNLGTILVNNAEEARALMAECIGQVHQDKKLPFLVFWNSPAEVVDADKSLEGKFDHQAYSGDFAYDQKDVDQAKLDASCVGRVTCATQAMGRGIDFAMPKDQGKDMPYFEINCATTKVTEADVIQIHGRVGRAGASAFFVDFVILDELEEKLTKEELALLKERAAKSSSALKAAMALYNNSVPDEPELLSDIKAVQDWQEEISRQRHEERMKYLPLHQVGDHVMSKYFFPVKQSLDQASELIYGKLSNRILSTEEVLIAASAFNQQLENWYDEYLDKQTEYNEEDARKNLYQKATELWNDRLNKWLEKCPKADIEDPALKIVLVDEVLPALDAVKITELEQVSKFLTEVKSLFPAKNYFRILDNITLVYSIAVELKAIFLDIKITDLTPELIEEKLNLFASLVQKYADKLEEGEKESINILLKSVDKKALAELISKCVKKLIIGELTVDMMGAEVEKLIPPEHRKEVAKVYIESHATIMWGLSYCYKTCKAILEVPETIKKISSAITSFIGYKLDTNNMKRLDKIFAFLINRMEKYNQGCIDITEDKEVEDFKFFDDDAFHVVKAMLSGIFTGAIAPDKEKEKVVEAQLATGPEGKPKLEDMMVMTAIHNIFYYPSLIKQFYQQARNTVSNMLYVADLADKGYTAIAVGASIFTGGTAGIIMQGAKEIAKKAVKECVVGHLTDRASSAAMLLAFKIAKQVVMSSSLMNDVSLKNQARIDTGLDLGITLYEEFQQFYVFISSELERIAKEYPIQQPDMPELKPETLMQMFKDVLSGKGWTMPILPQGNMPIGVLIKLIEDIVNNENFKKIEKALLGILGTVEGMERLVEWREILIKFLINIKPYEHLTLSTGQPMIIEALLKTIQEDEIITKILAESKTNKEYRQLFETFKELISKDLKPFWNLDFPQIMQAITLLSHQKFYEFLNNMPDKNLSFAEIAILLKDANLLGEKKVEVARAQEALPQTTEAGEAQEESPQPIEGVKEQQEQEGPENSAQSVEIETVAEALPRCTTPQEAVSRLGEYLADPSTLNRSMAEEVNRIRRKYTLAANSMEPLFKANIQPNKQLPIGNVVLEGAHSSPGFIGKPSSYKDPEALNQSIGPEHYVEDIQKRLVNGEEPSKLYEIYSAALIEKMKSPNTQKMPQFAPLIEMMSKLKIETSDTFGLFKSAATVMVSDYLASKISVDRKRLATKLQEHLEQCHTYSEVISLVTKGIENAKTDDADQVWLRNRWFVPKKLHRVDSHMFETILSRVQEFGYLYQVLEGDKHMARVFFKEKLSSIPEDNKFDQFRDTLPIEGDDRQNLTLLQLAHNQSSNYISTTSFTASKQVRDTKAYGKPENFAALDLTLATEMRLKYEDIRSRVLYYTCIIMNIPRMLSAKTYSAIGDAIDYYVSLPPVKYVEDSMNHICSMTVSKLSTLYVKQDTAAR